MPCELNEALVIASTIVLYRVMFNFLSIPLKRVIRPRDVGNQGSSRISYASLRFPVDVTVHRDEHSACYDVMASSDHPCLVHMKITLAGTEWVLVQVSH